MSGEGRCSQLPITVRMLSVTCVLRVRTFAPSAPNTEEPQQSCHLQYFCRRPVSLLKAHSYSCEGFSSSFHYTEASTCHSLKCCATTEATRGGKRGTKNCTGICDMDVQDLLNSNSTLLVLLGGCTLTLAAGTGSAQPAPAALW